MERVPIRRKVIQYEERRVVEEVPREVVTTDFYAVESIKQYYKEVVPEKKIEMVPVERKVRKIEYVPVEKYYNFYAGRSSTTRRARPNSTPRAKAASSSTNRV